MTLAPPSSTHLVPSSTEGKGTLRRFTWKALGTTCELQFSESDPVRAELFQRDAIAWVAAFEAKYSRFRPDSLLSRINAAAGRDWVAIDADAEKLLDLSGTIFAMTRGLLDVTALPLQRLWDYKAAQPRLPSEDERARARRLVGWAKVERRPGKVFLPMEGMALDFGGWGKEYAVDRVAQIAAERGIAAALVDFGHDLKAAGRSPGKPAWHIGLESPTRPGTCWGSLSVVDRAVASSGDYLRGFTLGGRRYGHIVDPRTGLPVSNGCLQATVIAPTCLQAGILSTAAFILGPEEGLKFIQETFGADGCLVTERARHQTRGFFQYVVQS